MPRVDKLGGKDRVERVAKNILTDARLAHSQSLHVSELAAEW